MLDDLDLRDLADARTRERVLRLLNVIETVTADLRTAQAEIQRLRDEITRLKGEQGKPTMKANTPQVASPDYSSEQERRAPRDRGKRGKREPIAIDREQVLRVDRASLPSAAEFKGYEKVVVQDVVVRTDNILFRKEKFYSASAGKTYLAAFPPGYIGECGPGIRALALVFYFACQMTAPKILAWLHHVGIQISRGEISNLLIKDHVQFHAEKDAVYAAGLRSSPWQHTDDTATRVNGQNHHCHSVDNPLPTTYLTLPSKERLRVLDILRNGQPRVFRYTDDAAVWLEAAGLSSVTRHKLAQLPRDQDLDESTLHQWLEAQLPGLGLQPRKWILDALAIAADHAQREWPVVKLLICDDAPQFTWITDELALCWVHAGRHYKKLLPSVSLHHHLRDRFLSDFWAFYDDLLAYRQQPTAAERVRLEVAFDALFARETGSWALDERIRKTRAKKACLLMVLEHPEIPLHTNPAELGARQRAGTLWVKRAISFGPRTPEGTKAWDTFMSLCATARKVGVNFYLYLHDRISGANQVPPLAAIIEERAKELALGASWVTA